MPNFRLVRTERIRLVGWISELKTLEHRDFLTQASGVLATVHDPAWRVLRAEYPLDRSTPTCHKNGRVAEIVLPQRYGSDVEGQPVTSGLIPFARASFPRSDGVSTDDVLLAAVAHGFEGGAPWPTSPLPTDLFEGVLHLAGRQRLLGALAEAGADGSFSLTDDQFVRLADEHAASQAHMLMLERQLLGVAEAFDEEAIDFRVLKGLALARTVYSDPSWRMAADLDILVPSERFDAAVEVATQRLSGSQAVPELRPGFDREFGKEALIHIGDLELDLHRTFVTGAFGLTIELDELFWESTDITLGGRRVRGLGAAHRFLHACYNAALGDYPVRLGAVRDLLLCGEHLDSDMGLIVEHARRWQGEAVVRRAAALAIEVAGPPAAHFGSLAGLVVPRREELLLRSYLTPARSYMRPLASLAVIPGLRKRARYARAILMPSADYRARRHWTPGKHVRRAMRTLSRHG